MDELPEDFDDDSDAIDDFEMFNALIPPLQITPEQLDTIKTLAFHIYTELNCEYTIAIIMAYFRWHNLIDTENTEQ